MSARKGVRIAVGAAECAFELAQRDLSREEYIQACEELADAFQSRAEAMQEEMEDSEDGL